MDSKNQSHPLNWTRLLLVCGLALAVGWGIRGNFGHEYGAGFAGCLAVLTGCLLSGREDWRRRVAYFGFFGAFGWGFGGSISYMQVISYTHSGHAPSQLYGFIGLFWIGFLWAAIGGAGAALPAVADRERLTAFFKPILFVIGVWCFFPLLEYWLEKSLATAAAEGRDDVWFRHKSPLYWFDSDYLKALTALLGLCLFDLWDRRWEKVARLPVFAGVGALFGWGIQRLLALVGWESAVVRALTYSLGDPAAINPETGQPFGVDNFLNNWPQWFGDFPDHVGWVFGLILGIALYFVLFGKFRSGASLFVYMGVGWFAVFFALPVFGGLFFTEYGGLRMTPPRSDDWAGVTGVFVGMTIWLLKNGLREVSFASVVSGFIGGAGFSGIACLKLMMAAPGNATKYRAMAEAGVIDPAKAEAVISRWANWQGQNWHSFLEQTYGFVNGVGIAVALGLLATRVKIQIDDNPPRRWTEAVAAFFVLIGITYVNLFKNVRVWVEGIGRGGWVRQIETADGGPRQAEAVWDVPFLGRLPGMDWLEMTPTGWFRLTYLLLAIAFIVLARRHLARPIALVPRSPLGKGQLLFLMLLWAMVVGNWERALPGMDQGRLLTEWIIFVNAILLTLMVLLWPKEEDHTPVSEPESFKPLYLRAWGYGVPGMILAITLYFSATRLVYNDYHAGHSNRQMRIGPDAEWRIHPILKGGRHR